MAQLFNKENVQNSCPTYSKIYQIYPNALSCFIVPLQGYFICNYYISLNKNVKEPRLVSNAILQHYKFEPIFVHLFEYSFYKRVSLTVLRRKRVHDNKNKSLKLKTNIIVVISWVNYMIFQFFAINLKN